jgi:DeoR/GlpR family transcriptional regulator of sugar metabolism
MNERHRQILSRLKKLGYMRVTALAEDLSVSDMTIRRDLEKLEGHGYLIKTHGGAYLISTNRNRETTLKETDSSLRYVSICRKAFSLIEQGDSVFFDSGEALRNLSLSFVKDIRFTVVTNSLPGAQILSEKGIINTILIGGKIDQAQQTLTGPLAEEAVKRFKYSKAFLHAEGINPSEGASVSTLEEIPIKRLAALNANEVIVLAGKTTMNHRSLAPFLPLHEIDTIITDWETPEDQRIPLVHAGIRVLIAKPEEEFEP